MDLSSLTALHECTRSLLLPHPSPRVAVTDDQRKWTSGLGKDGGPDALVWHVHNMPGVLRWLEGSKAPPNAYNQRGAAVAEASTCSQGGLS